VESETTLKTAEVLRLQHLDFREIASLLMPYGLICRRVRANEPIPGSFWGEPEAGLIANTLLVRSDTPIHSVLHEASHYVCMTPQRRQDLHTDAGGDYGEENAVCYLQILLADLLPTVGAARLMRDMDAWGYSFRLGSARAWFEQDAEESCRWLLAHRLIDVRNHPTWKLRQR
jgi:hypothetical protein